MLDTVVHPPFFLAFLRHYRAELLTDPILEMIHDAAERLEKHLGELAAKRPELADLVHAAVEAILHSHPAQSLTPTEVDTIARRAVRAAEIMTGTLPEAPAGALALASAGPPAPTAGWSFAAPGGGYDPSAAMPGPTQGETEVIIRQPVSTPPPAPTAAEAGTAEDAAPAVVPPNPNRRRGA